MICFNGNGSLFGFDRRIDGSETVWGFRYDVLLFGDNGRAYVHTLRGFECAEGTVFRFLIVGTDAAAGCFAVIAMIDDGENMLSGTG